MLLRLVAYVYRLALEWARLWSDDRESMGFKLPEAENAGGAAAAV